MLLCILFKGLNDISFSFQCMCKVPINCRSTFYQYMRRRMQFVKHRQYRGIKYGYAECEAPMPASGEGFWGGGSEPPRCQLGSLVECGAGAVLCKILNLVQFGT